MADDGMNIFRTGAAEWDRLIADYRKTAIRDGRWTKTEERRYKRIFPNGNPQEGG